MYRLKNEMLRMSGLNEEINFTEEDVLSSMTDISSFVVKLGELKSEMETLIDNAERFNTETGGNLIKGMSGFKRAFEKLEKAHQEARTVISKGVSKIPAETKETPDDMRSAETDE